uniref:Apyrase n=2 Tax=Corethron hystrix TaxID=216773 RepID=A0A6U5LCD9_9STRA|mmetsp:Transcript_4929/g.9855  ORF Transcript_4929/g.9855 Transcript_4929/m.9855 type:complete len:323 (+) Transcript_4929:935-1903(+)
MSLVPGSESKPKFYSILQPGTLSRNNDGTYEMEFLEDTRTLTGKHNEAGRGMELSELTSYENRLLSFDDRTGSIYELISNEDGKKTIVVPRLVVTEGDGDTDKGMKFEWATVKDGNLFVGSLGKEFTNLDGSIANLNNNWVAVVNPHGEVFRKDWTEKYNAVRSALGAERPGYLIHEAIEWSRHMRKWVFLPRRVSSEAYNDVSDERKGSNKIVIVDENFVSFEVVEVNFASKNPLHGFSSFKFIPGTKDRQIFALRSVEENCAGDDLNECKQWSYGAVFDLLTGKVLMEETRFPIDFKFEGVEFINIHIPSPMKRCKSLYI